MCVCTIPGNLKKLKIVDQRQSYLFAGLEWRQPLDVCDSNSVKTESRIFVCVYSMCVYMCVYVCARVCACGRVSDCVCACVFASVCASDKACVCVCSCMCVCFVRAVCVCVCV